MDHPLPGPDTLVRPWRTAAYVASAIAAAELLLLLGIAGSALMGTLSDQLELAAEERALAPLPQAKSVVRKTPPPPAAKRARSKTIVLVLNGNGQTGAAASAASRVHARGYRISGVANAPREVPRSLVMYRPGFEGEGRRLARDLGVKRVGPLDGMRAGSLGRAHVVFILGP